MNNHKTQKVLFICMGNICRSSMAEGILRHEIQHKNLPFSVDSAGTHRYHNGEQYDIRARKTLKKHGINVDDLHSRLVKTEDFQTFDHIFAADEDNICDLAANFGHQADRVELITAYSNTVKNQPIPDPYYGSDKGFDDVYDMLKSAINDWLSQQQKL